VSQVNLLPPEIRQRAKTRRLAFLIGIAGAVVIALLLLFWAAKSVSLQQTNQQIAVQKGVNAGLEGQIQELQPFQDLETQLETSQKLVATALAGEVSWSEALRDVQLIIPTDMALNSFTGSTSATSAAVTTTTAPGAGPTTVGNIAFDGNSVGTLRIARWLTRLVEVRGWANAWLTSATESGSRTNIYQFNTTVDLLPTALTARGQGATT
jgi:Tfp pilus assembly protein PilN